MTQTGAASRIERASQGTSSGAGRGPAARLLARSGIVGCWLAALAIGALHLIPPTSEISPVSRTISEYGLTTLAWAFNLGVIGLAAGSLAIFAALTMLRRLSVSAGVFGALWIAGLLTIVLFPKHNWAVGPSSSGQVHRMASLIAFLALPIAVMIITARRGPGSPRVAFWLGVLSLAWFSPIVIAILTSARSWWQEIPLGLVERGMALTEVVALLVLAAYAIRTSRETALTTPALAPTALSPAGPRPPAR